MKNLFLDTMIGICTLTLLSILFSIVITIPISLIIYGIGCNAITTSIQILNIESIGIHIIGLWTIVVIVMASIMFAYNTIYISKLIVKLGTI